MSLMDILNSKYIFTKLPVNVYPTIELQNHLSELVKLYYPIQNAGINYSSISTSPPF